MTQCIRKILRQLIFTLLGVFCLLSCPVVIHAAPCDLKPQPFIDHDLSTSFCELCSYGYVTIVAANPYRYTNNPFDPTVPEIPGAIMTNLVIEENLGVSGLSYDPGAPNPITYRINNGPIINGLQPPVISAGGSRLTFSSAQIPALAVLESRRNPNQFDSVSITFAVRRTNDPEGLLAADRTLQATMTFSTDSGCSDSPQFAQDVLPLREPVPQITKRGWNYDAGQRRNSQSDPVYGNNNDDVVWRIRVGNGGLADLQDLRLDDLMEPGSMTISHACPTEGSANAIAANNGVGTAAGCVAVGNTIDNFVVTSPFGDMASSFDGYEVDVDAGGQAFIYLVGKITGSGSCETVKTNTVDDVQWGCGAQSPAGGLSQTSAGLVPADTAAFYTRYNDNHPVLNVERRLTGTNTSQPVGSKGTMTIVIRNNSGGSVKNIHLADVLPPEYVVDATFRPQIDVTPAYGATYDGMVDTLTWTNENTVDPLANISPEFDLTSNGTAHPLYPDQINMLRHGDVAVVRFRVVLIESDYYDRNANLDVNPEEYGVTATDPDYQTPLVNTLTVDFDLFCSSQGSQTLVLTGNGNGNPAGSEIPAFPEDLDIAVGGEVFILTNDPDQLLTLPILLTNNGGHDAADYRAFVSFGATMDVVNAPNGCNPVTLSGSPNQPDPLKVWVQPTPIPSSATVYECRSPVVIAPGATVTFNFDVRKTTDPARLLIDDLSLRADVVGEITLSDGTPLWFPAPILRADGELDRANNYSMDATWARVIGFNLKKGQAGTCNENNPPTYDANGHEMLQIGEECIFHIETGGWFGFKTPGFSYIAVQNIDVVDEVPDGQAYIDSSDPYAQSTSLIRNVTLNPAGLEPLDEGWFDWRFNVPDSEQIRVADEWFVIDAKTRLLNKLADQRLPPNVHAANSHNVLVSTFDATFRNDNTGLVEQYGLGPDTVGYPNEAIRRVDLTVTEPLLGVIKEVCNEALYGTGTSCSNFVPVADDGDAYSTYLYRITLTNVQSSDGVRRAPAYDVTVTDRLDNSDLAYVFPFDSDGLDNDGDTVFGVDDTNGEGSIVDNQVKNGLPAQITFSHLHSSALQRIDPGQSVVLYYRVDYDDDAAPQQTFTNTVEATYDSLAGEFGSQSAPRRPNSDIGGARTYTTEPVLARVQIIPLMTQPKRIERLSNTPLNSVPGPQAVSIGEEIEYRINTLLPVALLRDFVIRDELPVGLSCAEAPIVNLDAAPYADAGFEPGGEIKPTCTENLVEWDFGTQRLTMGTGVSRYDFSIHFIARVENTLETDDADVISNGHPATVTTAEYIDETGTLVSYDIVQTDIVVSEPLIALTKAFNVTEADAGDTLTVTVTATNNGTATAYNLRVLEDLTGTGLSYLGNPGGLDPPDTADTATLGNNRPIFSWNLPNGIDVGATVSFSFDVRVEMDVKPLELLNNTIEADWTSLPGQFTALNSNGAIGESGSTTGMRNGTLPNSGHEVNDYEAAAASQVNVPAVTLSKTDLQPSIIPAIGAHKPFRIEIAFPEGVSTGAVATDRLNAAGLSYVLANHAGFDISYTFTGIASINGQAPAETAFNAVPADGASGNATWDIGTVVTRNEDDANLNELNPVIQIDYFVRINNDIDTDSGDMLQNGVDVSYVNGETGGLETLTEATALVTVSEPGLTLAKTLSNVTPGKGPADPPVAGDVLEYQLTLVNTGSTNSTAFDVNIVDALPAGLVLDPTFTPTATIDNVAIPGFVPLPAGAATGLLTWGRNNGDSSLDVFAGQILVITYHSLVQVVSGPGGLIENGVWGDWTSLEDVSTYERTGDGCPNISAPNDYCIGPVYATTTGIAPELVFSKTVINETTGENPGSIARPGDTLRYRLQVTNISAAPAGFFIIDEPDRLNDPPLFVPGSLAVIPGHPGVDASDPYGGSAGSGFVDIRDLTLDGGETLNIEFTVRLAPVITDETLVLNQAQLYLVGLESVLSDDPNQPDDEDPTQTLISSTPEWRIEKTSVSLTGSPDIVFAGDRLRYTITVKNIGTEHAKDVVLQDVIPENTSYIAGSTTLNGEAVADPVTGTSPLPGGLTINAPGDANPGVMRADATESADNVATISFDVQVDEDAASGTIISNQGFLNGSGIGSGNFLEQPSDDPETSDINDPTMDIVSSLDFRKSVFNQSTAGDGSEAIPGDVLRYRVEITNTGTVAFADLSLLDNLESLQPDDPMYFVPGTLMLTSVPAGADTANTDLTGGSKGTGLVDIRGLTIAAGETVAIEFTVQLAPVINNGTVVLNQAELGANGQTLRISDDVNPAAVGDQDPTSTLIHSAPVFEVLKTSTVLDGDPNVLLAGEALRYTLSIQNIGNEDAVDVVLQDNVPANTSYVPGSTTLNGDPVTDSAVGVSPLQGGLPIHAPGDATAGVVKANMSGTMDNVAVVTFDVVVNSDVADGTIIANQGFLSASGAGSGPTPAKASDDPDTAVLDDPTRDIVGNLPLIDAHKTVQLVGDPTGIVNPADVLRYTIAVTNAWSTAATGVVFTDAVPADTSYVADSVRLNGLPVGQPDHGVSPLIAGIDISSADRTPPIPGSGQGVLSPRAMAVITFDVRVNNGVATGTIISNQGVVRNNELPDELTDADGIDTNGDQPTRVVVGDVPQLSILKEVFVVDGTTAEPGRTLEYVIRVTNFGSLPATNVVLTDDLGPLAGQAGYIDNSASMNGSAAGVSYAGSILTAAYSDHYGDLSPGAEILLRFRVLIDQAVVAGVTITNTGVVTWSDPAETAAASVSLDVGGSPGSAILNGNVWHDANLNSARDETDHDLEGWSVSLYSNNRLLATVLTDTAGSYRLSGLNGAGGAYELRFRAAGARPDTPSLGHAVSPFTNGPQQISDIIVASGSNLQNLDLPITPNGVVYDSVRRTSVAGTRLTMLNAANNAPLPGQCFEDPLQQGQVTATDGFYKFDLNFSDPSCPPGATYRIDITPPQNGYEDTLSQIIAPGSEPTLPFSVPDCPGSQDDALPATEYCEITTSARPPPLSTRPGTPDTRYYLNFILSDGSNPLSIAALNAIAINGPMPSHSQIFNNHLPVDPVLNEAVTISKASSLINVSKGQLVPYTITLTNRYSAPLFDIGIVDTFPPGFKYVEGSARLNGHSREPHSCRATTHLGRYRPGV